MSNMEKLFDLEIYFRDRTKEAKISEAEIQEFDLICRITHKNLQKIYSAQWIIRLALVQ